MLHYGLVAEGELRSTTIKSERIDGEDMVTYIIKEQGTYVIQLKDNYKRISCGLTDSYTLDFHRDENTIELIYHGTEPFNFKIDNIYNEWIRICN
jgi:myo-inositol-hexaphosphate 3-phosphohydrolase